MKMAYLIILTLIVNMCIFTLNHIKVTFYILSNKIDATSLVVNHLIHKISFVVRENKFEISLIYITVSHLCSSLAYL